MNRKDRRRQEKLRKKMLASGAVTKALDYIMDDSYEWRAVSHAYKSPDPEPRDPEIPGVNVPPVDPEFVAKVNRNSWHDREELKGFIDTIWNQSQEYSESNEWTWSRNWDCKYVNIRFDMRDGRFTVTNVKGKRINLEQLKWQYKCIAKEKV